MTWLEGCKVGIILKEKFFSCIKRIHEKNQLTLTGIVVMSPVVSSLGIKY